MSKRKQAKKKLQEKLILEDKKFNRTLLIRFCLSYIVIISYWVFCVYWQDTKYDYLQYALYGKEVPNEFVCMNGDKLLKHKSIKIRYKGKIYTFCSKNCYNYHINHFQKNAFISDPFSGKTICKANALIGLKNPGKPEIIYFQNIKAFNQYYKLKNK